MSTPTPAQVLGWDVSGLPAIATSATAQADAILKASDTMYTTIHDFLVWKGKAKDAAETKADHERTQMRAIVTELDNLATACTNAHNAMESPLAEIKKIFQFYVHPPVTVADDWRIAGVPEDDPEISQEMARLPGLINTLLTADAQWGQQVGVAVAELEALAPASAAATETTAIGKIKKDDPGALSDAIAKNPTNFWAPDWPGITASTIIGAKAEVTRQIMGSISKNADMNKGFSSLVENMSIKGAKIPGFSGLGIVGGGIGAIPGIASDLHSGKGITETAVSEGAGAAASVSLGDAASTGTQFIAKRLLGSAVGDAAGAEIGAEVGADVGSVVPGLGTVVGLGVGAVVGYAVPKVIQRVW
ncbi:MAG: hypothetical protein J2P18_03710 [Nocardia sp.]|nr:hypothetical protein [Nocardia sp.]